MKTMWKSTFREVKQSFGRFIAILAIVALGVCLFAGLKVVRSCMIKTTGDYFIEKNFYDYRILSTVGYDEDAVEAMREMEDVRAVEGTVSFDILCTLQKGNEIVLKTYSLPEEVNKLELKAGRLPEGEDECVVDSLLCTEDQIGQKIILSETNDESDLENFTSREYTIVGIVQSPLYIQYERGNTSLGNGRISGFAYLPMEGYTVDYYTEVYVKFDHDFELYDDAYDAYIEEKEAEWEDLAAKLAQERYQTVKADTLREIEDGRKELEEGRIEGEQELEDARKELEDARLEIEDGEKQLEDGERELADALQTLNDKEEELAAAEKRLEKEEKTLADAEAEIEKNMQIWQESKDKLESGKLKMTASLGQMLSQSSAADTLDGAQLTEAEAQLALAEEELNNAYKQLLAAQIKVAEGRVALEEGRVQLADGKVQIQKGRNELAEGEKELAEARKELEDGKAQYEEGLAEYEDGLKEFEEEIADAEKKLADAEEKLAEMEDPDSYVLGRDTNVGYVCFESDSSIVDGIANVFPVFFFAVAALVCITTMNRMVEEQRTQIGVLKALGYSQASIMTKYLFYSGTAAAAGCVVGFVVGTGILPKIIWFAYNIMYRVDSLEYVFDGKLALISLIVSMLCSMGATWFSCRYELSSVAAQLMRPKAPKAGKRVMLERIPFIWNRLKFLYKVSYRNVFRYKKRFFMMVVGISGCTALLVTGFGVEDSIADVAHHQYERIQTYDMSVSFAEEPSAADKKEVEALLDGKAEQYMMLMEASVDLLVEEGSKSIYLVAVDEESDISPFVNLHTQDGETVPFPARGECVLSEKLAELYDIQIGDTITLRDENMNTMEVTVSGFHVNYIFSYVYMSTQTYESIAGKGAQCKTAYINLLENTDAHKLSASLMKLSDVTSVTVNADMLDRFDNMLGSLDLIVLVIIICAAGLAFIVLYNLTNINITERVREIATIKVLGFYKKETASYVFRENVVLTLIGALAGLVLGKYFHRLVMAAVKIDMVSFAVQIKPISYVYSILLTIAFAWFVNWFMGRKLDKISMTESLKSVD